ncbi:UNVERIFIED_CONTAM: hypothetical protein Sradi_3246800 [Sesamum radiatum]|uniref:Uncharacterized protein n=1 Tax=Sesamum radiatum TaxID=300843 RepID=A0AAW2QZS1_SESRA
MAEEGMEGRRRWRGSAKGERWRDDEGWCKGGGGAPKMEDERELEARQGWRMRGGAREVEERRGWR